MQGQPSLRPREHGAYAMLAFPVVSGLVMGGLSVSGLAFATLAVSAFVAHGSAMVLLGERGERLRAAGSDAARRRLAGLAVVGASAAVAFAVTAPSEAWPAVGVNAALAAVVGVLLLVGRTKTLAGEIVVAATFASAHGVVAAAGGGQSSPVEAAAAAWAASFALATLSVHALKYRFRGRGPGRWTVVASPLAAGAVLLLGVVGLGSSWLLGPATAAVAPKAGVVLALAAVRVHPRHLKRVGWSLVGADLLTLVLLAWLMG